MTWKTFCTVATLTATRVALPAPALAGATVAAGRAGEPGAGAPPAPEPAPVAPLQPTATRPAPAICRKLRRVVRCSRRAPAARSSAIHVLPTTGSSPAVYPVVIATLRRVGEEVNVNENIRPHP